MNVRPAASDDRERIRTIARDCLQSSYALSPQQIEMILEEEFSDTALDGLFDDDDRTVLVAEETAETTPSVFGFVTVQIGTEATIRWLHVDPETRGDGIATALFDHVRETVGETPIRACILEDAVEGGTFPEHLDLEQSSHDQIQIGGEAFAVTVFTERSETHSPDDPTVPIPESVTVDGDDHPVDRNESIPGREAPFFVIHSSGAGTTESYGYFCSQCGSTEIAADSLERLECENCGNAHRADEWDDAYL
ncbi:GNAT family N-acetyltransferase (plasmid) [Halomicrobium sp. HM KBTZ05]|uniref:GNAT family N-acetyltransferase n=1 Tax=Halomicrobium sp. HM KBTZ05 TaxID=3242663 RepID=UPI00355848DB